jgi:hypothetical protein
MPAGAIKGISRGQGRKPKAEELKLIEQMDLAMGGDWVKEVLERVKAEALKGSYNHAALLLAYKFGKPQDKIDITSQGERLKQITGMIVK